VGGLPLLQPLKNVAPGTFEISANSSHIGTALSSRAATPLPPRSVPPNVHLKPRSRGAMGHHTLQRTIFANLEVLSGFNQLRRVRAASLKESMRHVCGN
jgi:hypothetical protein